jgi:hypothetical protein
MRRPAVPSVAAWLLILDLLAAGTRAPAGQPSVLAANQFTVHEVAQEYDPIHQVTVLL